MSVSLARVLRTASCTLRITRKCGLSTRSSHHALQRCLGQPTSATHPFLIKPDEVTPGVSKDNYKDRRRRLVELIVNEKTDKSSGRQLIVLLSSPVHYMTQDIPYSFHQNTNFLYLTGFMEPDSCLVLEVQDKKQYQSHLFVPRRDPMKELWNGPRAGTDGALEHTGVDDTDDIENLGYFLKNHLSDDITIWYDYTRMNNLALHLSQIRSFLQEAHKMGVTIRQIEDPLHELRHIKSPEECELMSKASHIISDAFISAMSSSKIGMNESDIHAKLECAARLNGAQMLAFPPVVAGGSRANTLHYVMNNQKIDDGSLVLVDAGAYYHGYVSDVVRRFCPHHVGHWLGMDVHDTPGINRSMNLLPGMMVTIEPGLYIPTDEMQVEPAFRGIGIRIEDDVLITTGDPVVMTEKCPKDVVDIEEMVSS